MAARRIMNILRARPVLFLIHPMTAALLDIGGMYLLYLTPFYRGLTLSGTKTHAKRLW